MMKYHVGQLVLTENGSPRHAPRVLKVIEVDPKGIWGKYYLSDDKWYPEQYLMSLAELQQLRINHERYRAALATIYAEISQWSQRQTPPEINDTVSLIARIESLVSEVVESNEQLP